MGKKITTLAEKYPTPFYLYSQDQLVSNITAFAQAAKLLERENLICFALKANPNLELLKIMAAQGIGADIVSGGELKRALKAGIPGQKIVFSGVGKTEAEIRMALQANIYSFNVESFEELELINRLAATQKTCARICFRLNPKVKALTHKYISTGFKTHKFGILEQDILKHAQDEKYASHTKLVGLSIHIGSQLTDLSATKTAVEKLCQCAKKLQTKIEFIDVGGGLGVNYTHDDSQKVPSFDAYMEILKESISLPEDVKIVFEPGRCLAANTGVFVSQVLRTKISEDCRFVIIDGGMNDFARPSLYGAYHQIYPSFQSNSLVATDIVGPICETSDCFGEKRLIPSDIKRGDYIVIADTGAYGYSMSSNYNLRSRPAEVLIDNEGRDRQINKTQNLDEI